MPRPGRVTSGYLLLYPAMNHSQNANGLVWGLSTRKMRTPCFIQKRTTSCSSTHSACHSAVFEIERENILIKFRRILGILYRAVRTGPKPFAMLLDVRMIRRALECDIESDFQSVFVCAGDELFEILQRSELWMNGGVAAFIGTDCPGAANISGCAATELFFPFRNVCPIGWIGGR